MEWSAPATMHLKTEVPEEITSIVGYFAFSFHNTDSLCLHLGDCGKPPQVVPHSYWGKSPPPALWFWGTILAPQCGQCVSAFLRASGSTNFSLSLFFGHLIVSLFLVLQIQQEFYLKLDWLGWFDWLSFLIHLRV